ncbi:hypothetical protein HD554DRAFT_2166498 [Boletus coccyginus]|nr:hypothetical protein HD554DRAFT_2166498 [Boletus coccyginus]
MTAALTRMPTLRVDVDTSYQVLPAVKGSELKKGEGDLKVGYADAWLRSCTGPGIRAPLPTTVTAKLYDWTYTMTRPRHHPLPDEPSDPEMGTDADPDDPTHTIPLSELTRPDPILFYAEVPRGRAAR